MRKSFETLNEENNKEIAENKDFFIRHTEVSVEDPDYVQESKVLPQIVVDKTHSQIRVIEDIIEDCLPYVQSTRFDYLDLQNKPKQ